MLTAQSKQKEHALQITQARQRKRSYYLQLQGLLQAPDSFLIVPLPLEPFSLSPTDLETHPILTYLQASKAAAQGRIRVEKQRRLPGLDFSFFQGTNNAPNAIWYQGLQVGLNIPLWPKAQQATIQAARYESEVRTQEYLSQKTALHALERQKLAQLREKESALQYYRNQGQQLAQELTRTALNSYKNGEIDFFQLVQSLDTAKQIDLRYLQNLYEYNQIVLDINYLLN